MDSDASGTPGKFKRFNAGLAYYLDNAFKFFFTLFKFFIKVAGVIALTFPFVLFGMCLVSPDSAIKTLEALTALIRLIIDLFKGVG
ncbi:MAG: hypothetical protein LBL66_04610 [Clostridiales bacterium]|jgi:hypothetical protein|nr:hypothetical protein [Clostridiales bacterium]